MRDAPNDAAAERLLVVGRLLAALPRSRGFRIGADGSISVYPASPRVRLPAAKQVTAPAAKQEGSPKPPKRASRSEQGSERAPNARTRRSAARAAKHAQGRAQAEDRLRQMADKVAKVARWKACQGVWTAFMRDCGTPPSAANGFSIHPPATSTIGFGEARPKIASPKLALVTAARASLDDDDMLPDNRGWKRGALARNSPPAPTASLNSPPAESKKKGPRLLQVPQPLDVSTFGCCMALPASVGAAKGTRPPSPPPPIRALDTRPG